MQAVTHFVEQMKDLVGAQKSEKPTLAKTVLSATDTMHALVWNKVNEVKYVATPRPVMVDPKDIILRVSACTICGSDIHLYDGSVPFMHSGDILGHEFIGTVDEIGAEVKHLKKGQRVAVAFDIACGDCEFCQRKEFTGCKVTNKSKTEKGLYGHNTAAFYGYSEITGGVPGGQAEYVRVAYADVNCLPLPDNLPDEKALFLTDVIPTALFGAKRGKVTKGDVVAIWGMGPVGLMCAKFCLLRGAARVIGIDNVQERLKRAREIGIETIHYGEHDVVESLKGICADGVDVTIECVGGEYGKTVIHKVERALNMESDSADVFTEMFKSVRCFGRVSVIGVYLGNANHFPVGLLMEKGLTVRSGQAPVQRYWKKCMELILSGVIDPSFLITHRGDLSRGPEFYKMFSERKEGILKVFMTPSSVAAEGQSVE